MKKLQEMVIEDEKQRIPVAQGLPWTTDEPEVRPFLELVNWISGLLTFNVSTIMSGCSLQTIVKKHMIFFKKKKFLSWILILSAIITVNMLDCY